MRMQAAPLLVLLAPLILTDLLSAQAGAPAMSRPVGLQVRLDAPATDSTHGVTRMPPGWHVTMGPGALLYDSLHSASGRFSVESEIFVFPNSKEEDYGIVLGLAGDSWTGFLARPDGWAGVVRHENGAVVPVVGWAAVDSVPRAGGAGPVRAVLRVDAESDSIRFHVNGGLVASLPRATAAVDGMFGLRVGRGINAHVSRLDLIRHLAPAAGE